MFDRLLCRLFGHQEESPQPRSYFDQQTQIVICKRCHHVVRVIMTNRSEDYER
jgi:hypothetical protein